MSLTLVLEDGTGLSTSNTYATPSEANDYFDLRLYDTDWSNASTTEQETSLAWASMLIDELVDWDGNKYTEDQAMQWPRDGVLDRGGYEIDSDEIPTFLKHAVSEFAMHLIKEDRTLEDDTRGFSSINAGTLAVGIRKSDRTKVLPDSVWKMINFCCVRSSGQTRILKRV